MTTKLSEKLRLQKITAEIELQQRVLGRIFALLGTPILYDSGERHIGFRFLNPSWKHFCFLKAVRAVSGMNACLQLYQGGFVQEIVVIIRTVVECATHMDYVVAGLTGDKLAAPQTKYVESYFADFKRSSASDYGKPGVRQGEVHKAVGAQTDEFIRHTDKDNKYADVNSAELMSNTYKNLSSYVHCRYPEVMDMYGGNPARFHLSGMRGTIKDEENIEILETYIVTAANALRFFLLALDVEEILMDPEISEWFSASKAA